jgi:hypothetical protein
VEQIYGTTTVSYFGLVVHNLTLTGGTFNLGTGLSDTVITRLNGGAGALDFGSSALNMQADTTDFSTVNFTAGNGTLGFCEANPQTFIPRFGAVHPDIVQSGNNGLQIINNPLKAKSLTINQGSISFVHSGSFRDSVGSISATTGAVNSIDLVNDTIDVSGSVNFSGLTYFNAVTGIIRFMGNATQNLIPRTAAPSMSLPAMVHSGNSMLTQSGPLKCASFLQTAGIYKLNNYNDTINTGDFVIANGTPTSIQNLGGSAIVVQSGNASFSGQSAATMLNLSPGSAWTLSVPTMSKSISAHYASIGNCKALPYTGQMARPQFCKMDTGDINWNLAMVIPQIFDTLGAPNILVSCQRLDGSDTVDLWYALRDSDNAVDTVKMSFRNGASGAWSAPVNGTIAGDVGPVASNNMTVRRHVRWSVLGQFGNTFASDSLQIGLTAQDNFSNMTPIIMTAAAIRINTDVVPPVSAITYPVNNSSISSLASIAGTASDVGAGVSGLVISLENVMDTTYWNGTGWIKGQTWLTPAGLPVGFASWTYVPPPLSNGGKYSVRSMAMDKANNSEVPGPGVTFSYSTSAPGLPTIAITNRQKYTNSPVTSLTLSVQNADSMHFRLNAGPWSAWEQYAIAKTNMNISSGGQGAKYIYVEYKDRMGNMTSPVSDSTFYDTIPPRCAINTIGVINPAVWPHVISGASFDTMPGSGVKTVSVRLKNQATAMYWNGTAWAADSTAWTIATRTVVWYCSLATAAMNSGSYQIKAYAIDSAGNKGLMTTDSLQLIVPPGVPQISINKTGRFTNNPFVALTLSAQNIDSMHFRLNAGPWSSWEPYTSTKAAVAINSGGEGIKKVWVEYKNKIENITTPVSDSIVYDATAPQCMVFTHGIVGPTTWQGFFLGASSDSLAGVKSVSVAVKNNQTGLFWNGQTAWVADSSAVLASLVNGGWKYNLGTNVMPPSTYIVKAFATDSAGNNSPAAIDSINYAPVIVNNLTLGFTDLGDSAIAISWKVDKTKPFMKTVLYGYKYGALPDTSVVAPLRYADSSFVMGSVTKAGMWYFVTGLEDSAGNRSLPRFDSVIVANSPPNLVAVKDTSVFEDRPWQGKLVAIDRNGDSLRYRMANPPAGFTVDSVSGALSWTPEYAALGKNSILGMAYDGHGGIAADTFIVTVMALPPQIAYVGDSVAHEDTLFTVHFQISNIGKDDTASFIKTVIPSWAKMVGDTLTGAPKVMDVGKDTLLLVLSEKAGLADTLQKIITVLHTNHAPKLKAWSRPDSMYQYSAASWSFIATDIDKGDSLSITWTVQPKWLSVLSSAVKDTNWTFTMGGTPASTDAKWEQLVFSVRDTGGASITIIDSLFIVPLPTTVILKDKRQISYGAVKYAVSGSDYLDTALTFLTTLRSLDDTSAALVNKTTTGAVSFYPLVDGRYEFKAQAIDHQGLKDPNAPRDTFVVSGASHHVFADADSSWNMISVPAVSLPVSVVAGKGSVLHWDESGAEQDIYSYYKKPPDIVQTIPGMSYWRKSPDTVAIDLKRQDLRDTTLSIKLIKGKYGWNQISSPYIYPVKWSGSTVAWRWNNQTKDYELADSVLEPWKGYWVAADSQAVVRTDNTPVFNTTALAKKQSVYFAGKSEWQIKIKLTTGKGMDAENTLGFSRLARDGFDRLDLPKAPRFQGGRSVFFPHPDWNRPITEFASDIRNKLQRVNVFQIGVTSWQGDTGNSQLSFDGTENLASLYCFLVDPFSIMAISSGKQYPVASSGSILYKQIFVTDDKNFIRNFPRTFSLANPYPNPCRPMAHINYALPYDFANDGRLSLEPYQVKIALYDVMGRQVRELVYHKQLPGMYHILWDGKNNSERIVASGTYFCRLTAGKFAATTRLVMMK